MEVARILGITVVYLVSEFAGRKVDGHQYQCFNKLEFHRLLISLFCEFFYKT